MTRASKSANSYSIKADSFAEFAHNMLMESIDADLARGDTDLALFKAQYSGEQRIIKYVNVQIAFNVTNATSRSEDTNVTHDSNNSRMV